MNERIKQLAEQANEYTNGRLAGPSPIWFACFNEKFAELIIEECISQCWTVSELEHNGYVVSECSKRVRNHFGVGK